jgi:hypothetical protein
MQQEQDDEEWKRYLTMAASGGLTGAGMGAIGKILGGSRSPLGIIGSGLAGAAVGGTAIPGATWLGEQALGAPEEDDMAPYTVRSALGGAAVGGAGGALGGAYIGSGLGSALGKAAPGAAKFFGKNLPLDNIIVDKLKRSGGAKGALLGALLGAAGLGFMAGDEGQQLDTIRNLRKGFNKEPNYDVPG